MVFPIYHRQREVDETFRAASLPLHEHVSSYRATFPRSPNERLVPQRRSPHRHADKPSYDLACHVA